MTWRRPHLTLILSLASLAAGHAQGPSTSQWTVTRYTTHNGLPQNSVRQLALDNSDYLYIATEGGVTRFDGRVFRNVPIADADEGSTFRMRNLVPTRYDGVLCDDVMGNLYKVSSSDVLGLHPISSSLGLVFSHGEPPDARLYEWAVRRHVLQTWSVGVEAKNLFMAVLENGWWLLGLEQSLFLMRDTVVAELYPLPGDLFDLFRIGDRTYINVMGKGLRLVDTSTGELQQVHSKGLQGGSTMPMDDGRFYWDPVRGSVHCVYQNDVHEVVMGTSAHEIRFIPLGIELPKATVVTSVAAIREEGVLILGSVTKGMFLYRRRMMHSMVCEPQPGRSNSLYAQVLLPDGRVLATAGGSFAQIVGDNACDEPPPPLHDIAMTSVVMDNEGWLWAKSEAVVFRHSLSTGATEDILEDESSGACFLMEGDSLWISTSEGLWVYHAGTLHRKSYFNHKKSGFPTFSLLRDEDRRMLVATCHGLYRSMDSHCKDFEPVPVFQGKCVRNLQWHDELLFIGTYGAGAYVMHEGLTVMLPMDAMGALSHAHSFYRDGKDDLWIATDLGLIRVAFKDMQRLVQDHTYKPYYAYYGEWAGMLGTEFNGGAVPPYLELPDGRVSFPSMEGVVRFVPEQIPEAYPRHSVELHDLRVNGQPWHEEPGHPLPPEMGSISLEVSLPYWGDARNAPIEYRVLGHIPAWTPLPQVAKRITIPKPSSGTLNIEVRVMGGHDGRSGVVSTLPIIVPGPWYLTRTAMVIYVLGLILLVMLVIELYTRGLRRTNMELELKVSERTRELEALNTELSGSLRLKERLISIISHDIVSPLRFIARVAKGARQLEGQGPITSELQDTLSDLSVSAEKLHGHGRNLVEWARRQENSIEAKRSMVPVSVLVDEIVGVVREMAHIKGIEIENLVDVEDTIICDQDALSIILSNLINNAVVHNPPGCKVIISGHVGPDQYRLVVLDTGRGIPPTTLQEMRALLEEGHPMAEEEQTGGMRLGCTIIRELAVLIGAQVRIESNERGTKVTLKLPQGGPGPAIPEGS